MMGCGQTNTGSSNCAQLKKVGVAVATDILMQKSLGLMIVVYGITSKQECGAMTRVMNTKTGNALSEVLPSAYFVLNTYLHYFFRSSSTDTSFM
jgi:hypothetical protein